MVHIAIEILASKAIDETIEEAGPTHNILRAHIV